MRSPSASTVELDVLVVGAGIVGQTMALSAAKAGARTLCIDVVPVPSPKTEDVRTAALYPPAAQFLQSLGVWPSAQPLRDIRLIDASGGRKPDASIRLGGREIGSEQIAWNIANADLLAELSRAATQQPLLEVLRPCRITRLLRREDTAIALLDDGSQARTKLVIAADGVESTTRASAGIQTRRWSHGSTALAFLARATRSSRQTCIETHSGGQTLTLVPATEERLAAVWTLPRDEARTLLGMTPEAVAESVSRLSAPHTGRLKILAGPKPWPVRSLFAQRMTARRLALVGEAAHVLPPVGAQGLNLSLADVRALGSLVCEALDCGEDPGAERLLAAYARRRTPETAMRGCIAEGFACLLPPSKPPFAPLRRAGIRAVASSPRLRRMLAKRLTG